ncbi:hypothetical protein CR513_55225, partial [Mucuna pruriens]
MDLKYVFLNEEVYVEQLEGYVVRGKEDKALKEWYKKIDSYFVQHNFEIYPLKHTLYIKFVDPRYILIICLYVDDLIFTINNLIMIAKFREPMISCFEMIDLGMMYYPIFFELRSLCRMMRFLPRRRNMQFKMENSKPVSTPIQEKLKQIKESEVMRPTISLKGFLTLLVGSLSDIVFGVANSWRSLVFSIYKDLREFFIISKGTLINGIFYANNNYVKLIEYTDSDWARDLETRKNTTRHAFHLGIGALS